MKDRIKSWVGQGLSRKIPQWLYDRRFDLATEGEMPRIFPDCETGAIPPLGGAFGIPVVYDDRLRRLSSVYFEGGDHRELVYMGGPEFIALFDGAPHGDLCRAH